MASEFIYDDPFQRQLLGKFPVPTPMLQEWRLDQVGRDRIRVRYQNVVYEGVLKQIQYTDNYELSITLALNATPQIAGVFRQENKMNKYEAEIIADPRTKSVNIYLRLRGTETYITSDDSEVEREEGAEMPLYARMSREKYDAITAANRNMVV